MKASELTGAALAEWVGRAEGADFGPDYQQGDHIIIGGHSGCRMQIYAPHEDWAQGGPIIEREVISLGWHDGWLATGRTGISLWGETALIAAMRAYVATTFGHILTDDILHLAQ